MEYRIESLLLSARWLLLPLYFVLLASVGAIYVTVGRDALHLIQALATADEIEILLLMLSILDFVLVANLIVMVAISSFESFISKIEVGADADKPEWLGKLDSGSVKVKVALSIVMISAIHLLRAFMNNTPPEPLLALAGVHLIFVISAFLVARVDHFGRSAGGH
jgi:uncharacterized protein (TIGR00645 family)